MNEKLLSLCMITKNDEQYLADSLTHLKQIADEVIIADIGSSDRTLKIAKQSDVNVYQVEWNNNFSEIKNFCLNHAHGKWILFLQPNEIISEEHLKQIKQLLDNPNVEGYLFYIDYSIKGMGVFSPVQSLRLLRNRKEYRYNYQSFEMIPDELLTNIEDTNVQITYRDGAAISWDLSSRIILLEDEIIAYPENSYLQYMYGIMLLNRGEYELSLKYFKIAYENVNQGYLFAPHLYKCLSWVLLYLQEYTEALNILNEGIENYSFYTDFLILRSEIYRQMKQYGEAIRDAETCLKMRERPDFLVPGPEIGVPAILETIAEIYEETFNYQKALDCYLQAYDQSEANDDYLYKIGELTQITKSSEGIECENKQKMLGLLLYHNHLDAALKLIDWGKIQLPVDMECVLWSKCRMKNLEKWLNTMQASLVCDHSISYLQVLNCPNKELLSFYNNFIINADSNTDINEEMGLTCAEIHSKIGTYYEMTQNKNIALTAFLRSLQSDPLNEYAQAKISDFSNKDHESFLYYLEKTDWILENAWFKNKQDFIYYIRGIVAYKNRKYNQAVQFFSKIEAAKDYCPFIHAYTASCLWLDEKEDQIQLDKYVIINEFISLVFYICKDSILIKLNDQKYPYSGLIQIELERIKDIWD